MKLLLTDVIYILRQGTTVLSIQGFVNRKHDILLASLIFASIRKLNFFIETWTYAFKECNKIKGNVSFFMFLHSTDLVSPRDFKCRNFKVMLMRRL